MILPGLNSASLISIGQLCDNEYDVHLNKKIIIAVKDKEIILEGTRNYTDGLWDIPVQKSSITEINHTIPKIYIQDYIFQEKQVIKQIEYHILCLQQINIESTNNSED